jgi:hypothetical protein
MTRTVTALRSCALAALLVLSATSVASARDVAGGVTIGQAPLPDAIKYPIVPGAVAKLQSDGRAAAPADAPDAVKKAVWAANKLIGKPYRYGGGHARFNDTGYDCSGTVSFALRGGRLITSPLDSSSFMKWEEEGVGTWITVYTNPGHAFVVIAGLRLDTSASGDPSGNKGPRWRPVLRATKGFTARHPEGY